MKLHDFMADHRQALFEHCVQNLKRNAPERSEEELGDHLHEFIDSVIVQLGRAEGVEPAITWPEHSQMAARTGGDRERRGYRIDQVVQTYAALSISVGDLAAEEDLAFDAREYRIFNESIDRAIAAALDEYYKESRQRHESEMSARLGFLAHELRNALSSARMAFSIVERGQVPLAGKTVDIVRRGFRRMERLIEMTMLEARISGGNAPPLRNLPLIPLLRDIEASAPLERGILIVVSGDDALEVVADEALLTSAVGNLVQNAIKFSKDGARVQVRASRAPDGVVIEVEDECGGLPPGDPERLFRPFVQDSADRRGVGLGLAITRDVVEAMSGEIRLEDIPGKGCLFRIRLRSAAASSSVLQ